MERERQIQEREGNATQQKKANATEDDGQSKPPWSMRKTIVTGAPGNAINIGVRFYLPDCSRWPPQLGFRCLVL